MGIFSGKTKTYVSSTVYNLAGDANLRPDFVRSIVAGTILTGSKVSLGSTLVQALFTGVGMNQRRFFRWAQNNYALGLPTASLDSSATVDGAVVRAGLTPLLTLAPGQSVRVTSSSVDAVDVDYWARHWVALNRPDLNEEDWSADYDTATQRIVLELASDTGVSSASFPASSDFLWALDQSTGSQRKLLFVLYNVLTTDAVDGAVTTGPTELFTYRMGTGNVTFDAMLQTPVNKSEFFPAIPLRMNNKSIRDASLEHLYDAVKPAFKKLTNGSVDDLLDQIEDNENIADIDYCFLVHGVSLNTKEKEAKRYLYKFFKSMIDEQHSDKAAYEAYRSAREANLIYEVSGARWLTNNSRDAYEDPTRQALTGEAQPPNILNGMTPPVVSELNLTTEDLPEFNVTLSWHYIDEAQFVGNAKTFDGNQTRGLLAVGDFWFHVGTDIVERGLNGNASRANDMQGQLHTTATHNRVYLFQQKSKFRYSRLELVGLTYKNLVYAGHSVTITAKEALESTTDESGFLVPMHYPSYTGMGLLRGTQLASSCSYLVFNTYVQKKQKWYQTGFFRLIIIIASAVLSVVFPPAGIGLAGSGILGANLAIGAAMGFTTALSAAIAGAIANALAAMILSTLIQKGAVLFFGEKIGAIIGTIVTFVAMTYAKTYANTGTFDVEWGKILRAENLLKLTDAVTGAYTSWLAADTRDIQKQISGLADVYAPKFEAIDNAAKEMLGSSGDVFDAMMLTDSSFGFGETSSEFYSRVMMTGSDIAELSQSLVYDYAEISLELPTPST